MEIKITTLNENTAASGCLAEWGLSMLVEADGHKILFDTGTSICAVHNAQYMGIDLAAVERIVLSHGHYDHAGGLLTASIVACMTSSGGRRFSIGEGLKLVALPISVFRAA